MFLGSSLECLWSRRQKKNGLLRKKCWLNAIECMSYRDRVSSGEIYAKQIGKKEHGRESGEAMDETPRKRPGDELDCTPKHKRLFLISGIPSTPKAPETLTRKCLTIQQKQELIKAYDTF